MSGTTISFGQVSNRAIYIGENTLVNDSTFLTNVDITNYGTLEDDFYKGAPVDVTIESTGVDLNGTLGGAVYEDVYGLASGVVVKGGILYGEDGGTITNAQIESAIEELLPGSKSYNTYNDNGELDVSGTATGNIDDGNYNGVLLGAFEYDKAGGVSNNPTAINAGIIIGYAGAIINNPVLETDGKATIDSGATLDGAFINGGTLSIASGAVVDKGAITYGTGGTLVASSGAPSDPTIVNFNPGDMINLVGTPLADSSEEITIGGNGIVNIGPDTFTFDTALGVRKQVGF